MLDCTWLDGASQNMACAGHMASSQVWLAQSSWGGVDVGLHTGYAVSVHLAHAVTLGRHTFGFAQRYFAQRY